MSLGVAKRCQGSRVGCRRPSSYRHSHVFFCFDFSLRTVAVWYPQLGLTSRSLHWLLLPWHMHMKTSHLQPFLSVAWKSTSAFLWQIISPGLLHASHSSNCWTSWICTIWVTSHKLPMRSLGLQRDVAVLSGWLALLVTQLGPGSAQARAPDTGLRVGGLQLWEVGRALQRNRVWHPYEENQGKPQVSSTGKQVLGSVRSDAKDGHLRLCKLSPGVQEAVLEGFPELQGWKDKGIPGGVSGWYLESITSNGKGQRGKGLAQELDTAVEEEENVPCRDNSPSSLISSLPPPSRCSELQN